MDSDEKLIYMANQIAANFAAQGEAKAVPAIADHIKKFWDPEMRRKFLSMADTAELHSLVRKAVPVLKEKQPSP